MKNIQPKLVLVLTAIAVAAVFRLLPHWPNFTPMAAIALMGGALLSNRILGFIVPLLALLVSDVLTVTLINYRWISLSDYFSSSSTALLYLSFVAMTAIGYWMRNRQSWSNLAGASLLSAIVFFLISNFGDWTINTLPKTASGLLATYELGIPFFGYNLMGNLFYTFLFFGIFYYAVNKNPKLAEQRVRS
ncbi:MAG: hypothetical protein RLZZ543_1460 [Bacteroidota bacterium]|jgi:hypothetical protein